MGEPRVVIVTGMSGAGRSQTAKILEDIGYFVVDNLPLDLIGQVIDQTGVVEGGRSKLAVVIDTRAKITPKGLEQMLLGIHGRGVRTTVLFLDADDQTLATRFEESRRPHPVQGGSLADSIAEERQTFEDIRGMADIIIDTSTLNVHDLRRHVQAAFQTEGPTSTMRVDITSFGFKRGVPRVVDLLFDVRFLPNPHWVDELRPFTGRDEAVRRYVFSSDDAGEFVERTTELLEFLIPRYEAEGKSYLTIGVGCTGGKHRSVAIADELARRLESDGIEVEVRHRDLPQEPHQ